MRTLDWTADDLAGTARAVDVWLALATAGLGADVIDRDRLSEIDRLRAAATDDTPIEARAAAGTALVEALSALGRAVHDAGRGARADRGSVAAINVSHGGVPKRAVASAEISWRGIEGDRQASRRHHGRVWQALCLWSAEVIDELQAEGHPIAPGAAGENLTLRGVDFAALRPGTRLRVGDALVEVTLPSLPCKKNAQWFADGDFNRIHHERNPGQSRLYALVVEPGAVRTGDAVIVEP